MDESNKCEERFGGISFFWSYSLEYYDDIEHDTKICHGIAIANDLVEAMRRICDYYGEDNICAILHMEGYDFGTGVADRDELLMLNWSDDATMCLEEKILTKDFI